MGDKISMQNLCETILVRVAEAATNKEQVVVYEAALVQALQDGNLGEVENDRDRLRDAERDALVHAQVALRNLGEFAEEVLGSTASNKIRERVRARSKRGN